MNFNGASLFKHGPHCLCSLDQNVFNYCEGNAVLINNAERNYYLMVHMIEDWLDECCA